MSLIIILILLAYGNVIYCQPKLVMHQTPVFGNVTLGYYYINLFLGTPPQKQTFILDTGSSNFVVPCKPCLQCGTQHISPEFDLTKSSTAERLTCSTGQQMCRNCHLKQGNDSCEFVTRFVQQSQIEGYYVKDMVLLTSNISLLPQELIKNYDERVKTTFGCITKQTNLFKDQKADGILALSPNSQFNFIKQIYRTHYPFTKQNHTFSICLSSNGGVFTVGGLNTRLHSTGKGINVRFRKDQNVYSLNVSGVYVGNNNLNVTQSYLKQGYGIFIDSGATFTYFQHSLYQSIITILEEACLSVGCKSNMSSSDVCYVFPQSKPMSLEDQMNRFPNITLKVGRESDINWTSHQYLRAKNISNREMCLAFQRLDRTILGTTWMINKDVHFDMNRQQITIYDSNCQYQTQKASQKQSKTQTSSPQVIQKQINSLEQISDLDQQALIISIVIVVVVLATGIGIIIGCRCRNKHNNNQQTSTIIGEPPLQQYHDEISMTSMSHEQYEEGVSSRDI